MERFGLDARRAFELLTRLASMQERRVTAVAQDIVETRNVPTGSPGKDKPADRS
jgi:AmiR/NasT family two-component response regulator